ncbi:hypothetical protein [Citrobacter meridianamericanus]
MGRPGLTGGGREADAAVGGVGGGADAGYHDGGADARPRGGDGGQL